MSNIDYANYTNTQAKIRTKASMLMEEYISKNGIEDRQAIIEFAKAIADKYGESAGAYACEMYDAIAKAQGKKLPPARIANLATWEEVGSAVNGSLAQSAEGKLLSSVVERLVKQVAEDSMLQNAARDGAEYAWIPDGGACAYCVSIASRGWQRASRSLQSAHADHIHQNCNCEFAIRFSSDYGVKGYDPNRYKRMYEDADGNTAKEKLNSLRRELEDRDLINAQKRELYEKAKLEQ